MLCRTSGRSQHQRQVPSYFVGPTNSSRLQRKYQDSGLLLPGHTPFSRLTNSQRRSYFKASGPWCCYGSDSRFVDYSDSLRRRLDLSSLLVFCLFRLHHAHTSDTRSDVNCAFYSTTYIMLSYLKSSHTPFYNSLRHRLTYAEVTFSIRPPSSETKQYHRLGHLRKVICTVYNYCQMSTTGYLLLEFFEYFSLRPAVTKMTKGDWL